MSGPLRVFDPLKQNRNYATVWASQLISTLGDRVHHVALAALVFQLTGSLTKTGLALMATALPDLLLGMVAGVAVDRFDRRMIMIISDLLRVPLVSAIPFLAYHSLPLAFVDLFLVNTLSIANRPAANAIIPTIVPTEKLAAANSLSSISDNSIDIIGYPVAGAVIGLLSAWLGWKQGLQAAFIFDAGTFLISGLLLLTAKTPAFLRVQSGVSSIWAELKEGIAFVHSSSVLRANTLVMLLGPLMLGAATPLLVGYAWTVLGGGEWEYAMLGAGISAGSILGGFWVGVDQRLRPGLTIVAGLALMGIGVMATAAVHDLWFAVATIAISGVGSMMVLIPSVTLVQVHTPEKLLGRVFSVRSTLIFGAIILSNAVGGWAGEQFGVRESFFVCGLLLVVSTLVALAFPSVRGVDVAPITSAEAGFGD
ncbi:MAG TPA: MFS transporter [Nitrolancea sp.]|nr:MFS transporter [Nitrolancea sp.]